MRERKRRAYYDKTRSTRGGKIKLIRVEMSYLSFEYALFSWKKQCRSVISTIVLVKIRAPNFWTRFIFNKICSIFITP